MASVSEQLRQARLAQNLSIEQVAEITKMRGDHLRALEEGNFDVFPAPVYIRGFTRTYSTLLKLDVPKIMAALEAELGQTRNFSEPPPLSSRKRGLLDFVMLQLSKVDWRKSLIVLGVIVVCLAIFGAWFIWHHYRSSDPLKGVPPGTYQSTQKISGETLPLPAPGNTRKQ
jgi:cytoskeletal protein RodZ